MHNRLQMALTSAHSLVFGRSIYNKTYKWCQGQWQVQWADFDRGSDMINLSFVNCQKFQEKVLEFSFQLSQFTPAEVPVGQSFVHTGEAY